MAPMMLDDRVHHATGTASKSTPILYQHIDEQQLQQEAKECLANYGTKFEPSIVTATKGLYFYTNGHRVLDWTSGQMSCLIGHGHPEVVEVIRSHAANLDHVFSGIVTPPVISLAKRLTAALPAGLDRAFFLSTGGESNEAAIRLAKTYTGKFEVVGLGEEIQQINVNRNDSVLIRWLGDSWHGMTAQAQGIQFKAGRQGHGPNMPGSFLLPAPNAYRSIFRHKDGTYDWETELNYGWNLIDSASCGSLAAVIVECIQSSAGIHVLPPGYLKAMKTHCEKRGMLLIVDEAQTGIGRCGDLFAIDYEDVVPDILTLSKTLGNGIPLSAVVASNKIDRVCKEKDFLFYTTHINDPLPAAVGDKVLEIVMRDNLVANSRARGAQLHAGLKKLKERYGCIGDVRGRGLMAGIEIVSDRETKGPAVELGRRLGDRMMELGLWAQLSSHKSFNGVFRIAPPIVISESQVDDGLKILEEAFATTEGSCPLY